MKGIVNVTEKSNPKHSRSVASAALQDPRYRQIILRIGARRATEAAVD